MSILFFLTRPNQMYCGWNSYQDSNIFNIPTNLTLKSKILLNGKARVIVGFWITVVPSFHNFIGVLFGFIRLSHTNLPLPLRNT
ncbi:hypothetical protein NQ317_017986 [Molorchus minor]|uniref:Uncharacterized protein n=1 Tax=Molorchus minor TaxID=1323400 RepID=A0ABQ9J5W9_9CUCU|nr:hypothetical protein NQ317_017986 [Molorchus minor]